MSRRKDRVKHTVASGTSTTLVLSTSPLIGYVLLDATDDGRTVPVIIVDGSSWQSGEYVYAHSTLTLTLARFIASSTGSPITFSAGAVVAETWTKRDAERANPPSNWYYLQDYASAASQLTGATDVSTEFQAMCDAMQAAARAQGGGEFVCDLTDVVVLLSGALQDTSNRNCQIVLPTMRNGYDASPDNHGEFAFINRNRKNVDFSVFNGASPSYPGRGNTTGGRIISSITGTGTLPSVFGCGMASGATSPFARTGLHFENIEIYTSSYSNATNISPAAKMTALNAANAVTLIAKNLFVVGGPMKSFNYGALPTGPCYGVRWPTLNNDVQLYGYNCTAIGFETGHLIGEHQGGDLQSGFCKWAAEVPQLNHAYLLNRMDWSYCPNGLRGTGGASYGRIMQVSSEFAQAGDANNHVFDRVADVDDASSFLHGDVSHFHLVEGAVGPRTTGQNATLKTGGTNFTITRSA